MAILDELVTQIENPDLRARIATEVEKLAKQKKYLKKKKIQLAMN